MCTSGPMRARRGFIRWCSPRSPFDREAIGGNAVNSARGRHSIRLNSEAHIASQEPPESEAITRRCGSGVRLEVRTQSPNGRV